MHSVASSAQALTSTFDGVTVVGEIDATWAVRAEPKDARGEVLLSLRIEGDRLAVEPRADATLAPWSGYVPAEARAQNTLADWNFDEPGPLAGLVSLDALVDPIANA